MKIVIDIPEEVVTTIQNGEDYRYDIHTAIAQGTPYEERPKGKWIYDYDDFYHCSLCGRGICTEWSDRPTDFYPFCHCGADMRKDKT